MTALTPLRFREERPKTMEAVYRHLHDIRESLRLSKKRHGEEMHDMAKGQLVMAEEAVTAVGYALWPTDGHGRLLAPVFSLRRRTRLSLDGQLYLFEVP